MSESGNRDDDAPRRQRRRKEPLEYIGSIGGAGSLGAAGIIISILVHQNSTFDLHSELIRDNRKSQDEALSLLKDMRSEFSVDIHKFNLKHASLDQKLGTCKVGQSELMRRIADLEETTLRRREFDELQSWVSNNFTRVSIPGK